MKDRYGHDFTELCSIQEQNLSQWETKLDPTVFAHVANYVRTSRQPAGQDGVHRVYRGQDIVQIIVMWPDISPVYPAIAEDVI